MILSDQDAGKSSLFLLKWSWAIAVALAASLAVANEVCFCMDVWVVNLRLLRLGSVLP